MPFSTPTSEITPSKAYLFLCLACVFWGAHFIVAKMMLPYFPVVTLTTLRWIPAALIACLFFHKRGFSERHLLRAKLPILTVFSIFGIVLFPITLYFALSESQLITLALYISATPLVIALLNALFFREHISCIMAIAILISFFGVILLITQNDPLSLLNITVTFGDFWSIAAALSWCGYCFLFPFKPTQITHQSFLSATLAIGACLLIPLMIWELTVYSWDITHVPVWCWIGLLYIILFPSFGSYYFWNQGLTILGSNKGAQFNHLVPLIAVILGIFFLDNSLHPYHISGAICIIFAISLSIYAHKRKI